MTPALVLYLTTLPAISKPLPSMPTPKVAVIRTGEPLGATNGRFMDRHAKIAAVTTVSLLSIDAAQTCRNLARSGHEDWLHTQNCGVATTEMAGEAALAWGAAYLAHRTHHHKLERALEWLMPASNAIGLAYSKHNGAF